MSQSGFRGEGASIKQRYISSALLLMLSTVIVKVISATYKIPLTAYIGAVGRGYFSVAYNLCLPVHALTMGAFPLALTKLVSTNRANGDNMRVWALRRASGRLFLIVGLTGMAVITAFAKPYAELISSSPKSIYTILALAPSIFFSCLCVCHRAFAEGFLDMKPTAVSQIIEAAGKMIFGLLFARMSMSYFYDMYLQTGHIFSASPITEQEALSLIYPLTSACAMLGVTLGSVLSYIFVRIYMSVNYRSGLREYDKADGAMNELVAFAMPLVAATAIQGLSGFIDTASTQYCLSRCDSGILSSIYNFGEGDIYTYVLGVYSSVLDFKNLVPSIVMTLGITAVPAVSMAYESSQERFSSLLTSILKYSVLLSAAGGVLLCLYGNELLSLFYGRSNPDIVENGSRLLFYSGISIAPCCIASTTVFCTQSLGYSRATIMPFIVSAVIRVLVNFILIPYESINLAATAVSSFVGFTVIYIWNIVTIRRKINARFNYYDIFIKPSAASTIVYFAARYVKQLLIRELSLVPALCISLLFFAVVYILLSIIFGIISFKELKMLK